MTANNQPTHFRGTSADFVQFCIAQEATGRVVINITISLMIKIHQKSTVLEKIGFFFLNIYRQEFE